MERNIPIIIGGLAALAGILYIVYKVKVEVSSTQQQESVSQSVSAPIIEETEMNKDTPGTTSPQPTNNQGSTGSTNTNDK